MEKHNKVNSINVVLAVDHVKGVSTVNYAGVGIHTTERNLLCFITGKSLRFCECNDELRNLRDIKLIPYQFAHKYSKESIPVHSVNGGEWTDANMKWLPEIMEAIYREEPLLLLAAHGDGKWVDKYPDLDDLLSDVVETALCTLYAIAEHGEFSANCCPGSIVKGGLQLNSASGITRVILDPVEVFELRNNPSGAIGGDMYHWDKILNKFGIAHYVDLEDICDKDTDPQKWITIGSNDSTSSESLKLFINPYYRFPRLSIGFDKHGNFVGFDPDRYR